MLGSLQRNAFILNGQVEAMKATFLVMLDNSESADQVDAQFIERIEIQRTLMIQVAAGGCHIDLVNATYYSETHRSQPQSFLDKRFFRRYET